MLRIRTRDWGSEKPIRYFQRLESWLFTGPKVGSPIPIFIGQKAPQHGWATLAEVSQSQVTLTDWLLKRPKTVYLAQPYSHPHKVVRQERYNVAVRATGNIIAEHNVNVFSPIVHSHNVAEASELKHGWETWGGIDLDWVDKCDEVWVLSIDGVKDSKGLRAELAYARMLQKTIRYVTSAGYLMA